MIQLTLAEIASTIGGALHDVPDPESRVTGLAVSDSREAGPGSLFAAIAGARVDGHDFAAQAVASGAVCVLASRPVGVPAIVAADVVAALGKLAQEMLRRIGSVTVIAVTGSSGKTSTKDLLAQVIERHGPTVATPRSFNSEIGLPLATMRADQATRYLILEMGARHKGDITHLTRLTPPSVGLVINVGSAHIGEFGGREGIAAAKGELVEALPDATRGGLAVLNADDDLVAAMANRTTAKVLLYGRTEHAAVRAVDVQLDQRGRARFTLTAQDRAAAVTLQVLGEHQVSNALGAAAVAYGLGMDINVIADALSHATPRTPGRLEVIERPDGITIVNDAFNANPDSMAAGLNTLAVMATGRRTIAVLGEMRELGDGTRAGHEQIGRLTGDLGVDVLIAVGAGEAQAMADAARDHCPRLIADVVADGQAALSVLRDLIQPGDMVLAKASHALHLEELATALAAGDAVQT